MYEGLHINNVMTLGDMRAIKRAFGEPVEKIDWKELDAESIIQLLVCLVVSHGENDKSEAENLVSAIPFDQVTIIFDKISAMMVGSGDKEPSGANPTHQDGNIQEGRAKNEAAQA